MNKVLGTFGIMNIVAFLTYAILILVILAIVQPFWIFTYPTPKTSPSCSYKYCFDGSCQELNDQDLRYSINVGMRQFDFKSASINYFVILAVVFILHVLIAKFGLLNVGTYDGRCNSKYIVC